MIRQISCYILIVLLPVIYSEAYPKGSPGIEVPQRSPECEVYCKERNKVCFSAPTKCGACLQGFVHYDGRCMELLEPERNDFEGDSFIDRVAEQRELEKAAQAYRILGFNRLQNLRNQFKQAGINDSPLADKREDEGDSPQRVQVPPGMRDTPQSVGYSQVGQNSPIQHNKIELDGVVPFEQNKDLSSSSVEDDSEGEEDNKVLPPGTPLPLKEEEKHHLVDDVASMADVYFLAVVAACSVAGVVGLVVAGVCWYRLQKNAKAASEVEYPAYGVTGPPQKEKVGSPGDRKLAQSAQMYHYQHQKQQMIAMEKANGDMNKEGSEADSDEENEEGDYTVYECPGLAPTGEMEVKNPLFNEDTPVTPNK